jgi:hypothetical protein
VARGSRNSANYQRLSALFPRKLVGAESSERGRWAFTLRTPSDVRAAAAFEATSNQAAKHPRSHCTLLLGRPRSSSSLPSGFHHRSRGSMVKGSGTFCRNGP